MSNEEFRAYVARICGAPAPEKGPCVRGPEDEGYYPPSYPTGKPILDALIDASESFADEDNGWSLRDEGRSDGQGKSYAERNA